ncbi:MAG TPA: GNAT family N-acetyltransferase [Roseiflexaceae bacterium]
MSEFPLVIRLCELEDTPQIVTMIQAQVAAAGRQAPDPDALAELVHALLSTQFSDFILAELEGRTVGVLQINYRLSTWDVAPYAAIEDFYLAPAARGGGVGTRMLDYACARAEGRGSTFIQSSVRAEDWAARRLYEAFGFTATPQSLWRSDLPLGCAVPTDEPAADEQTETSNQ